MQRRRGGWTGAFAASAFLLALASACDSPSGPFVSGPGGQVVRQVLVTPEGQTVQTGGTLQFQSRTVMSDGDTTNASVTWSATGGIITTGGLFTAGQTAGVFRVIARAQNGVADTVGVNVGVPSTNPTLVAVVVSPATASVAAGGAVQFSAAGRLSNGGTQPVDVSWRATGGGISGTGLYTAGVVIGPWIVIATGPGGLADTASVNITGAGGQ